MFGRHSGTVPAALCLIAAYMVASPAAAEPVVFARQIALSPDGNTLAFSWAGDIWTVSTEGGAARRLTVNPAHESDPVWSYDGKTLAFASRRDGAANVFVMNADGTDIRRLTFSDQSETPTDFSPDGEYVYFHSHKTGEVSWDPRMYRVPVVGGQSGRIMEAAGSYPAVSPDGRRVAFTRGGSKWWRTGYRGSANWDIWIWDQETGDFSQATRFEGTDMFPRWDEKGEGVYFLCDRVDTHNLWYLPLNGTARQITRVTGDRIRDFSVSRDGRTAAYTQWDKLFVMSLPRGEPREIHVTAASDSTSEAIELMSLNSDASEIEASPDGEEVALVVRGEIFVIKTEEGKPTRRVTDNAARDWNVTWSPDGKALFFVSDRAGREAIYRAISAAEPKKPLADSLRFKIERVTGSDETELSPLISPDGEKLSFIRGRGDIVVRDLKTGVESVLLEAWNEPTVRWSPDSKWIAYAVEDEEYNPDVWIVPADGESPPVNVSQHPDFDGNPQWSADGQILAFSSQRTGFDSDLYMVFLSPALDQKSSAEIDDYFKKAGEKVKKLKPIKDAVASGEIVLGTPPETQPAEAEVEKSGAETGDAEKEKGEKEEEGIEKRLRAALKDFLEGPKGEKEEEEKADEKEEKYEYELDTAYRRLRRVTDLPNDQSSFALAPAGDLIAFTSDHEGDRRLFSVKWNGKDRERIMSAGVGGLHWTLDGKRLFYINGGKPGSCSASGGESKTHDFRAKMAIDHREEAEQKFNDAARMMGRNFYHPTLKGLDWPALTEKYRDLALRTHTYTEFNEVFDLLQGRLNGSHMGIYGPSRGGGESTGYLGVDVDPEFPGPGLKVSEITPRSPADRAESRLFAGDILLKVNSVEVGPAAALDSALIDTVGDEIIIEYIPSSERPKVEADKEGEGASPDKSKAEEKSVDKADTQPASSPTESDEPKPAELVIRPISYGAFSNLRYDAWVEANRKYVEEKSGGRVAYVHIAGMGASEFNVFERDLYAAAHDKDGLIIDVRNNGGGWTADWVMAVLNVRRHAYTIGRGGKPGYPQGRLIFYSWTKPTTMMCNQYSYSNAEIVSHAFKNLGRGPLVGETTFGAVISTGGYTLIDGTLVRMPFRGWYTLPAGADMESNGAEPTVRTALTPADEQAGRRPQLDAAIQATLQQISDEEAAGGD